MSLESFRQAKKIVPLLIGLEAANLAGQPLHSVLPEKKIEIKEQTEQQIIQKIKDILSHIVSENIYFTDKRGKNTFSAKQNHLEGGFFISDSNRVLESPEDFIHLYFEDSLGQHYYINCSPDSVLGVCLVSQPPEANKKDYKYYSDSEIKQGVKFGERFIMSTSGKGVYMRDGVSPGDIGIALGQLPAAGLLYSDLAESASKRKQDEKEEQDRQLKYEAKYKAELAKKQEQARLLPQIRQKITNLIRDRVMTKQTDEHYTEPVDKGTIIIDGQPYTLTYYQDMNNNIGSVVVSIDGQDNAEEVVLQISFSLDNDPESVDFYETPAGYYQSGDYIKIFNPKSVENN